MMGASSGRPLRAGVIAAGRGDRLTTGSHALKPLVKVGGQALIDRVLTSIAEAGASEVVIIVNEASTAVRDEVAAGRWPFAVRWLIETTPSSMHSFLRVVETLAADGDPGPFLVSTVDTVAVPGAFARFMADVRSNPEAAIALALTTCRNDEKPLLVRLASDGSTIVALGAAAGPSAAYATAGYYAVRPSVLREADEARRDGLTALRVFLTRLLQRGYRLAGVQVAASIDVDRPLDLDVAEDFLKRLTT